MNIRAVVILLVIINTFYASAQKPPTAYLKFTKLNDLPTRLIWPATFTDGQYIYAVNGYIPIGVGYSAAVLKYNPATDKWATLSKSAGYKIMPAIAYLPARQSAYVFGGTEFTGRAIFQGVQELALPAGSVTKLKASNPVAATHAGAAAWGNLVYVFGGTRENQHTVSFLYSFNPLTLQFTQLKNMPESLETTGAITNGILYTLGGYDQFLKRQSVSINAYDIAANTWAKTGKLPEAISDNCIAVYGSLIFVIGSYDHENYLGYFNTQTKTFTVLRSNLVGRRNAGAAVVGNKLYVFGGTSRFNPTVPGLKTVQVADLSQLNL